MNELDSLHAFFAEVVVSKALWTRPCVDLSTPDHHLLKLHVRLHITTNVVSWGGREGRRVQGEQMERERERGWEGKELERELSLIHI